jgi:hypothetical protein
MYNNNNHSLIMRMTPALRAAQQLTCYMYIYFNSNNPTTCKFMLIHYRAERAAFNPGTWPTCARYRVAACASYYSLFREQKFGFVKTMGAQEAQVRRRRSFDMA